MRTHSLPVTLHPAQLVWKFWRAPRRMHSCTHCALSTILFFLEANWRKKFWPDSL
jgi:hypothetical protein